MGELFFYSLIGGVFSLIGGFVLLWKKDLALRAITPLLSFAAGAFLAAVFFDVLPEAVEMVEKPHPVFLAVVVGFTAFFALERFLMAKFFKQETKNNFEKHSDHTESLPILLILGDSFHNFLDGVVIALAYLANPSLGLITTIAIAAHELPQEIGDFSVLLSQGWPKSKIILVNIMQSLLTIPGVFLGVFAGQILEPNLPYLLGAAGGGFLYLGASNIIPELHHKAGHKHFAQIIGSFVLSLTIMYILITLSHGHN